MYTLMKQFLNLVKGISIRLTKDEAIVTIIFGLLLIFAFILQMEHSSTNLLSVFGICLTVIFALYIFETSSRQ